MRILIIAALIFINFVLSTTWPVHIFGITANTSIVLIVSFAILRYETEGATIGFFVGLLHDVFFGTVLGFNALLYTLIGYFSGKPFKQFYAENYVLPIILVAISTFSFNIVYYIVNFLFRARLDFFYYLLTIILPTTLFNVVVTLPLYIVIYLINSRLVNRENKNRKIFGE